MWQPIHPTHLLGTASVLYISQLSFSISELHFPTTSAPDFPLQLMCQNQNLLPLVEWTTESQVNKY